MITNKGSPANGIMIDSLVDGCTYRASPIGPAVEHVLAILAGNSTASLEAIRSAIFDVGGPYLAIWHGSSDSLGNPRVYSVLVRYLNGHVWGIGIVGSRGWPFDVLVPVHLARGGPVGVFFVVPNAAITENEVALGGILAGDHRGQAEKGNEALGKLGSRHGVKENGILAEVCNDVDNSVDGNE